MKKLIMLFVCMFLCVGCGEEKEVIPTNTMSIINEEGISFDVVKIETTSKIKSSMPGSLYYSNDETNKVYIDMVLEVTNNTDKEIECDELFEVQAKSGNGIQAADVMFLKESDGYSNISAYESLMSLEKARVHVAISVLEAEEQHNIELKANGEVYKYEYTLNEAIGDYEAINKDQVIKHENVSEVTLKDVTYTSDLLPQDTSGAYRHYPIDSEENIYLCINFQITNLGSNEKDIDKFMAVKAVYDQTYEYDGFMVVEDEDLKGFSSYEDITPLTTRNCYMLIEVPKVVQEKSLQLKIFMNGQDYIYEGSK